MEQSINPYIIRNLTFGDEIQRKLLDTFRLIFQNVGDLGIYNESFTLEAISKNMFRKDVDVACLLKTNTKNKTKKNSSNSGLE